MNKIGINLEREFWLLLLPLMFIPSASIGQATAFGTLEVSDFLIVPFIVTLLLYRKTTLRHPYEKSFIHFSMLFIIWALLGISLIMIKYNYPNGIAVAASSVLKLAKFTLFGAAGVMVWKKVNSRSVLTKLHYTILVCGLIVALSLIFQQGTSDVLSEVDQKVFKSLNMMSVTLGMIITYTLALVIARLETKTWTRFATVALLIMLVGFAISRGRGGWFASIAGLSYFFIKQGKRASTIIVVLVALSAPIYLYQKFPAFRRDVMTTFNISAESQRNIEKDVVDSGHRVETWINEAGKFFNNPLTGTGYFHRGYLSKLWATGSHNYWLQMFLETGLIGGLLTFIIFSRLWLMTTADNVRKSGFNVPLQAVLITAFIGGLSGEYFYGGLALITLLLLFSSANIFPRDSQ